MMHPNQSRALISFVSLVAATKVLLESLEMRHSEGLVFLMLCETFFFQLVACFPINQIIWTLIYSVLISHKITCLKDVVILLETN